MNQKQYARRLRQKIMATAVKKHGFDKEQVHEFMQELGFGTSLRELGVSKLLELYRIFTGRKEYDIPDEFKLDPQGRYMYYLMKFAGWNMGRVRALMISKFEKSDWSLLGQKEKRAVVQILKNYADSGSHHREHREHKEKNENEKEKE